MVLRFVRNYSEYDDYSQKYVPMAATIGKTYQCLPIDGSYSRLLFYNDHKEWQKCRLSAFAPVEPKPFIEWEE